MCGDRVSLYLTQCVVQKRVGNYQEASSHIVVTAIFGPRYMSQKALFDWLKSARKNLPSRCPCLGQIVILVLACVHTTSHPFSDFS